MSNGEFSLSHSNFVGLFAPRSVGPSVCCRPGWLGFKPLGLCGLVVHGQAASGTAWTEMGRKKMPDQKKIKGK